MSMNKYPQIGDSMENEMEKEEKLEEKREEDH